MAIVTEAIDTALHSAGRPVDPRLVHTIAVTILRRFMAAGIAVSDPAPPPDAA